MAEDFGADEVIHVGATSSTSVCRRYMIELMVAGWVWVSDVSVIPKLFPEGIKMIRRGGMYILAGMFVDVGKIPVNPHVL